MTQPRNLGKWAESYFEEAFNLKKALVCRFPDYHDINFGTNSNKKNVAVDESPADFLITFSKQTFLAEVKSVEKATTFSFSNIRPAQWKAAISSIRNGGKYFFILYFKKTDQWYWVPARVVVDCPKESLNIGDLQDYKVSKTFT